VIAGSTTSTVLRVRRIGQAGTLIHLGVPPGFPPPRAGQFVQIACQPSGAFRLRRPFSICRWQVTSEGGELGILFSVVGEGSAWLDARREGECVEIIGPLGRPFLPVQGRTPILVAGGRGVAPLLLLAEELAGAQPTGLLLYGARDLAAIFPTEESPYPVHRATLDGSVGSRGTVIDLFDDLIRRGVILPDASVVYSCGPTPMLAALSARCESIGLPSQVSVETVFGCGTGLCAGCAIPMKAGADDPFGRYAFACSDGPVFDGSRVDWEGVRE
jgi:dihydroorotate dehydrogenase electron transfer subunit